MIQIPAHPAKRILLVYPEIPQGTYWSWNKALEFIDKKSAFPPLGLQTVGAMLPKHYELRLVDMNVDPLTDEAILWADAVFCSAMIVQKASLEQTIARIKALGKTIVLGGPYPSSCFREIPDADHFVLGEVENILSRFLEDWENGTATKAYASPLREKEVGELKAHFGEDATILPAETAVDINTTPAPRYDLLPDASDYQCMSLQTSRGCPVGCEFCDIWRRFGRKPRCKNIDNIVAELDALKSIAWEGSVFVVDDNFIGDKRRTKEILRAIAAWQRANDNPFDLFTEATLTLADDEELLELMREAQFDMVFIGIETPSEESLKETRKFINTNGSMADKVAHIQSYGIQVSAGFIIGFDSDPDNIGPLMTETIQALGIPMAMVGLLQALPDTDLHDRLTREGRLLNNASGNNTHEFSTNFVTKRPAEKVVADYKNVLQAIYAPDLKAYFKRCTVFRDRWKQNPHIRSRTQWHHLRAMFRFLWTSLFHRYRFHCWRFLFGSLFKKPAFYPMAVTLGIQGHHFRQITKLAFEMDHLESYCSQRLSALREHLRADFEAGSVQLDRWREQVEKAKNDLLNDLQPRARRLARRYGVSFHLMLEEIKSEIEHEISLLLNDSKLRPTR